MKEAPAGELSQRLILSRYLSSWTRALSVVTGLIKFDDAAPRNVRRLGSTFGRCAVLQRVLQGPNCFRAKLVAGQPGTQVGDSLFCRKGGSLSLGDDAALGNVLRTGLTFWGAVSSYM
jgi:hypothetical protein